MTKNFSISVLIPIFLTIFISTFFLPVFSISSYQTNITFPTLNPSFSNFIWPAPGYHKITSKFGYRNAPTSGASSYHGGIDIAAPENSSIIAIADGIVTYVGWYGANGYTIIIEHSQDYKSIYGHVSPDFLVSINTPVSKGELIAKVGPKYITPKSYTTYRDASGKYTNGATTRTSSTFLYHKKQSKSRPRRFFLIYP